MHMNFLKKGPKNQVNLHTFAKEAKSEECDALIDQNESLKCKLT